MAQNRLREYELLFMVKPHLADTAYKKYVDMVKKYIKDKGGDILLLDEIGLKDLAYDIKNNTQAYYIQIQFSLDSLAIAELKNKLNVNEDIIRFFFIKLDSIIDRKKKAAKNKEE